MKILTIGDLHFKESLGYAEFVSDRRVAEREAVYDALVKAAEDVDMVVMMGDQLNGRSNHADTLKRFVGFLERFGDKPLRLLVGNHCRWSSGASAMDFLKEIKGKNWRIISQVETETIEGNKLVFLPYFTGPEVMDEEHKDWASASKKLVDSLPNGSMLFAHHAISGTFSDGIPTESFEEVLLPMDVLLNKYKTIVAGHIHSKGVYASERVVLTGSSFTDCVGEEDKSVWKFTIDMGATQASFIELHLPVRPIIKLENPTLEALARLPGNAIVKVMVTDSTYDVAAAKKALAVFDGHVVVEQIVKERVKEVTLEGGELTVDKLLQAYARQRQVDFALLQYGFSLIQ
jgi:DNA repair exonuclease SbcCD nuclease subunit